MSSFALGLFTFPLLLCAMIGVIYLVAALIAGIGQRRHGPWNGHNRQNR